MAKNERKLWGSCEGIIKKAIAEACGIQYTQFLLWKSQGFVLMGAGTNFIFVRDVLSCRPSEIMRPEIMWPGHLSSLASLRHGNWNSIPLSAHLPWTELWQKQWNAVTNVFQDHLPFELSSNHSSGIHESQVLQCRLRLCGSGLMHWLAAPWEPPPWKPLAWPGRGSALPSGALLPLGLGFTFNHISVCSNTVSVMCTFRSNAVY